MPDFNVVLSNHINELDVMSFFLRIYLKKSKKNTTLMVSADYRDIMNICHIYYYHCFIIIKPHLTFIICIFLFDYNVFNIQRIISFARTIRAITYSYLNN